MALSKAKAAALWGELRTNFLEAERVLKDIIASQAWAPLGYKTFSDAWKAHMSNVTLASEMRVHVVYQLLEEGITPAGSADLVKGITPSGARILDRKRQNGISSDCATVREHLRKKPEPADTLHIKIGHAMLAEYRRIANVLGESAEDIAKEAVEARFAELVKPKRKRSV